MPLHIVTDDNLNRLCYFLTQEDYIYYPVHKKYHADLWNTGCRPMELLLPEQWNYIDDSNIELQPLKGNDLRYFTADLLSDDLLFAIQNNIKPYQGLTLRQLTSVTKKILPVPQVQTIDKSAIDYLFRYNYVKQLKNSGMSDADIADKMGWSSSLLAASYYSQTIYSTEVLPPLPPIPTQMKLLYSLFTEEGNTAGSPTTAALFSIPANTLKANGDVLEFKYAGISSPLASFHETYLFFGTNGLTYQSFTDPNNWEITGSIMRKSSTDILYALELRNGNTVQSMVVSSETGYDFTASIDIYLKLHADVTATTKVTNAYIKYFEAP